MQAGRGVVLVLLVLELKGVKNLVNVFVTSVLRDGIQG
jgi:hypothetical protein